MGEIADMMLDGTLCQMCGVDLSEENEDIFGDEAPGYPITCAACGGEEEE